MISREPRADGPTEQLFPHIERELSDRPTREEVKRLLAEAQYGQLKWIIATVLTVSAIAVGALVAIVVAFC